MCLPVGARAASRSQRSRESKGSKGAREKPRSRPARASGARGTGKKSQEGGSQEARETSGGQARHLENHMLCMFEISCRKLCSDVPGACAAVWRLALYAVQVLQESRSQV